MAKFDVTAEHQAPGDNELWTGAEEKNRLATTEPSDSLDSEPVRREHKKLLEWYFFEKDKQALNRLEMAIDHDFYDNIQWREEDAAAVRERGQMPLVYNEVAPMVDWLIGTERRSRVDWKVLPRTEDDVQLADVKTDVLKYISDVNRVPFVRSRAFSDAVKVGVGWFDDGVRDDPTKEAIYSKYEDWRNVLWDSTSYELDLEDARYLFRWRWVDEDIACSMFPRRYNQIMRASRDAAYGHPDHWDDTEGWGMAFKLDPNVRSGTLYASGMASAVDAKRRRVRLIECQYRKPAVVKLVADGPLKGAILNQHDQVLADAVAATGSPIIDKVMLRVHFAVFTEADMLAMGPSIYRHNRFSLTPIWCYRRGRDRLPYGAIRRVRDIQEDLNKRASKALFMLNTNQIFAEENAVEDWNVARDEVDRPDGLVVTRPNKKFEVRRDTDGATGQINMMTLAAQSIQKSAGVANENLGRQTNAVSGEAIKARQLQGSVVTTEPFDNLRLAVQVSGEKQLSLAEQFFTQEKVIRLTGNQKGALKWVKINVPEMQPDGSIRFLNDIASSMADFVVSEQDYAGTMRQVMFDAMSQLATRLPPEVALRVLTMAFEFSDLPNKDEVADEIRRITGDRDPNKPMSPEEQQQAEQQMQQQMEDLQFQRQQAMVALEEQQAKIRELNARAMKLEAEAHSALQGPAGSAGPSDDQVQAAIMQVRAQLGDEIERLSDELRKAQSDLANRTLQINRQADTELERERIRADAQIRVAEIARESDKRLESFNKRLDKVMEAVHAATELAGSAGSAETGADTAPTASSETPAKTTKKRKAGASDAS